LDHQTLVCCAVDVTFPVDPKINAKRRIGIEIRRVSYCDRVIGAIETKRAVDFAVTERGIVIQRPVVTALNIRRCIISRPPTYQSRWRSYTLGLALAHTT